MKAEEIAVKLRCEMQAIEYARNQGGMSESDLKALWNDLSSLVTDIEHTQQNTLSHDKVMEVLKDVSITIEFIPWKFNSYDSIVLEEEDFPKAATAICKLSVPQNALSKSKVMLYDKMMVDNELPVESGWYNTELGEILFTKHRVWTNFKKKVYPKHWFKKIAICNLSVVGVSEEEIDKMAIEFADFKQYRKGEYHSDIIKSCKRGANWALNKLQSLQPKEQGDAQQRYNEAKITLKSYYKDPALFNALRIAAGLPPTPEKGGEG